MATVSVKRSITGSLIPETCAHINGLFETPSSPRATASKQTIKNIVSKLSGTIRDILAAGRQKEGELATTSLKFEFHLQFPCGAPSTELSDFRQSARSGNERECKQTLKNTCQG